MCHVLLILNYSAQIELKILIPLLARYLQNCIQHTQQLLNIQNANVTIQYTLQNFTLCFFLGSEIFCGIIYLNTNYDDGFMFFLENKYTNYRDVFLTYIQFSKILIIVTLLYFLRFTWGGVKKNVTIICRIRVYIYVLSHKVSRNLKDTFHDRPIRPTRPTRPIRPPNKTLARSQKGKKPSVN